MEPVLWQQTWLCELIGEQQQQQQLLLFKLGIWKQRTRYISSTIVITVYLLLYRRLLAHTICYQEDTYCHYYRLPLCHRLVRHALTRSRKKNRPGIQNPKLSPILGRVSYLPYVVRVHDQVGDGYGRARGVRRRPLNKVIWPRNPITLPTERLNHLTQ